jgi:hypothetical protein
MIEHLLHVARFCLPRPQRILQLRKHSTSRALLALAGVFTLMNAATPAIASPCRNNNWQPTFVHDLRPGYDLGPYCVMPDGRFARLQEGNKL